MVFMSEAFMEYDEWMVVLYDNILILANTDDELLERVILVITKCSELNIVLKMAKTFIGFKTIKFFGYEITDGSYELGNDRKSSVDAIPFPTSTKGMQSFLGSALFFKDFVQKYSDLTAPLHDMTQKNFNWNKDTWVIDYHECFNKLKEAIQVSMTLYFPDYDLEWIMRTDASIIACAAVLF